MHNAPTHILMDNLNIIPLEYEEQLGDSTTLIQNIIDDQRDNVNNLIDRSNFSSALTALTVKEYISIDNDGISEIPIKEEYVIV
ncbi:13719_t:CDS:2 [Entrophospora sp. SA101]|nr:13715_t:CDS:2 [Entrophospora sp. SA101]CAJ0628433.1 13719_t:CDS:2 [Entrophospora sp. SA101]